MLRLWIFIRGALIAFALLFVTVTCTPVTRWWASALAQPWLGVEGDVLVVLGGSDLVDALGDSSYLRALYAVRAMRQVRYKKVILCGAGSAPKVREFLAGNGVAIDHVVIEDHSESTQQNVSNALRLLSKDEGPVVLLTSDYHIYRALRVFRKQGLEVRPHPVPDVLKRYNFVSRRWSGFLDLCEEAAKTLYYRFQGYI